MNHLNVEIKARCADLKKVRKILSKLNAVFRGNDHQIDTYFRVNQGRLKLREGDIENFLTYYERPDEKGPKESRVFLFPADRGGGLKEILSACLGVRVTVDKRREIFSVDNVKFHLDEVQGLGAFVEIEAKGESDEATRNFLTKQCSSYVQLLEIRHEDLVAESYSDLLMGLMDSTHEEKQNSA